MKNILIFLILIFTFGFTFFGDNYKELHDKNGFIMIPTSDVKNEKAFAKEIEDMLEHYLTHVKEGILENNRMLEDELRKTVRKHCLRKYKKYPMIVPTIIAQ